MVLLQKEKLHFTKQPNKCNGHRGNGATIEHWVTDIHVDVYNVQRLH